MTNYPLHDYPSTPIEFEPDETLEAQRYEATKDAVEREQKANRQFLYDSLGEASRDDQAETVILDLFWSIYESNDEAAIDAATKSIGEEVYYFLNSRIENQIEREMD